MVPHGDPSLDLLVAAVAILGATVDQYALVADFGLSALPAQTSVPNTVSELLGLDGDYQREAWEEVYMYTVSVIGAVWLSTRVVRHWQLELFPPQFAPRTEGDGGTSVGPTGGYREQRDSDA